MAVSLSSTFNGQKEGGQKHRMNKKKNLTKHNRQWYKNINPRNCNNFSGTNTRTATTTKTWCVYWLTAGLRIVHRFVILTEQNTRTWQRLTPSDSRLPGPGFNSAPPPNTSNMPVRYLPSCLLSEMGILHLNYEGK